jgi:phosphoenolpyruvate synthase/pyruvate phosphate dikinase
MYSNVVLDVGHHYFEEALELKKEDLGVQMDTDLKADDWRSIVGEYKKIVEKRTGKPFPQEPREQLWGAIGAVFGSWMNQRAITYRRLHAIPRAGAPRSTCRPWCSATWARIAPPASPSRAIPRPAPTCSTASTW